MTPSPAYSPIEGGRRPRGPPPFIVQILRAPLTFNNIIALAITHSVYKTRSVAISEVVSKPHPCANHVTAVFGFLTILFALSIGHNILAVMRFHRIRRQVFGESMCAARRRWKRQGCQPATEEERQVRMSKFKEMGKKMPSVFISTTDVMLAVGFLGMWVLTTLIAKKEGKVELGVAYASIGSLVAW